MAIGPEGWGHNPYDLEGRGTYLDQVENRKREKLEKQRLEKLRKRQRLAEMQARASTGIPMPAQTMENPFGLHYDEEQMRILDEMSTRARDDAASALLNGGSVATHVGEANSISNVAAMDPMTYRDIERMHEQMKAPSMRRDDRHDANRYHQEYHQSYAPRVKDLNDILHDIENNNREVHTKFLQEAHLRGITNYELVLAIVFERYFKEPTALDDINDELMKINKRKRDGLD